MGVYTVTRVFKTALAVSLHYSFIFSLNLQNQLTGLSCSTIKMSQILVFTLNGHKVEMVDEVSPLGHRLFKIIYDLNVHATYM